ncbi:MAG: ANTAR domain-containing protein [Actinomycetales bacterium]|nr:ANTAR domain-containing protein [Actinomycetales bacterium]
MRVREFGHELVVRLLDHVTAAVPDALGAGVVLREGPGGRRGGGAGDAERGPLPVAGTGVAVLLDRAQADCGEGPVVDALAEARVVACPTEPHRDLDASGWPALADAVAGGFLAHGVAGVVAYPGEWGEGLTGVLTLYLGVPATEGPILVTEGPVAVLGRFEGVIGHALALVEQCAGEELRAEQMLRMIQYRRVVEQAKGAVMVAVGVDGPHAFEVLSRASQHFNIRLRNLAIALVEHIGGGTAEHPEDPEAVVVPSEDDRRVAAQVWAALTAGSP